MATLLIFGTLKLLFRGVSLMPSGCGVVASAMLFDKFSLIYFTFQVELEVQFIFPVKFEAFYLHYKCN